MEVWDSNTAHIQACITEKFPKWKMPNEESTRESVSLLRNTQNIEKFSDITLVLPTLGLTLNSLTFEYFQRSTMLTQNFCKKKNMYHEQPKTQKPFTGVYWKSRSKGMCVQEDWWGDENNIECKDYIKNTEEEEESEQLCGQSS